MMVDYRAQQKLCPYYLFTPNPTDPRAGHRGCIHPSPNIGTLNTGKITTNKNCTHGNYKTHASEYTCRIITSLMRTGSAQTTLEEFD